jgi:hypothetical protein
VGQAKLEVCFDVLQKVTKIIEKNNIYEVV